MKQSNFTVQIIEPSEGYKLTQSADVTIEERIIISDKIYLAVTDKVENWKEITNKEAEAIKAEQARLAAKLEAKNNEPTNTENL